MKVKKNPFTDGTRGQAFGVVGTTLPDGTPVLRGMPTKGNQGKSPNHVPAHTRARIIGGLARTGKATLRLNFPSNIGNQSAINRFQKYNMTAANGVFDGNNELVYSNLRVSEGSIPTMGVALNGAVAIDAGTRVATLTPQYSINAQGEDNILVVVVHSRTSKQFVRVATALNQSLAPAQVNVPLAGYEDAELYFSWLNSLDGEMANSTHFYSEPE